jgi:diketogulonate reductase-like aldo/keto reductase
MMADNHVKSDRPGRMPGILYGTAWKKDDTERLVATAIRQGFRGVDTACQPKHYNEEGVGAGVAASLGKGLTRDDLYLQTKFTPLSGQDPERVPYDRNAPLGEQVAQSFAVSLRNLRVNRLDCLVLHSPMESSAKTLEVWRAMESLVSSAGVGQLGISNCYQLEQLEALYDAALVKPAVVQNRFHAPTRYDTRIRAYCRERSIIYQSFWTLTANPDVLANRNVVKLASKYGRTAAQILFRYLTQSGVVPLTGTHSATHMRQDLEIFEFQLDGAERMAMDALFREHEERGGQRGG